MIKVILLSLECLLASCVLFATHVSGQHSSPLQILLCQYVNGAGDGTNSIVRMPPFGKPWSDPRGKNVDAGEVDLVKINGAMPHMVYEKRTEWFTLLPPSSPVPDQQTVAYCAPVASNDAKQLRVVEPPGANETVVWILVNAPQDSEFASSLPIEFYDGEVNDEFRITGGNKGEKLTMREKANGASPAIFGTWRFEVKILDSGTGAESSALSGFEVNVFDQPLVAISADPTADLCLDSHEVQYAAAINSEDGGSYSYSWCAYNTSDGSDLCHDGFNDNSVAMPTRSWANSVGEKSVSVTVTSTVAGCSAESLYSFEVFAPPSVPIIDQQTSNYIAPELAEQTRQLRVFEPAGASESVVWTLVNAPLGSQFNGQLPIDFAPGEVNSEFRITEGVKGEIVTMDNSANGAEPAVYGTWQFAARTVNSVAGCESTAVDGFSITVVEDGSSNSGEATSDSTLLLSWDLTGQSGDETWVEAISAASGINLTSGKLRRGAGIVPVNPSNLGDHAFVGRDWDSADLPSAKSDDEYFEFIIAPASDFSMRLSRIQILLGRQGNGPDHFALFSDVGGDGFSTQIGNTVITSFFGINEADHELLTFDLESSTLAAAFGDCLVNGEEIVFRLYGWSPNINSGQNYNRAWLGNGIADDGNDLTILGFVAPLPVAPQVDQANIAYTAPENANSSRQLRTQLPVNENEEVLWVLIDAPESSEFDGLEPLSFMQGEVNTEFRITDGGVSGHILTFHDQSNLASDGVYGTWEFEPRILNSITECRSAGVSGFTATVVPSPAQDSLATEVFVFDEGQLPISAMSFQDSVVIRWAPGYYETWVLGMEKGYQFTVSAIDSLGVFEFAVASDTIFPKPEGTWGDISSDDLLGLAHALLYDHNQAVYEGPQGAYTLRDDKENRHGFALFTADMSLEIAELMGLAHTYYNIEPGYTYEFQVAIVDEQIFSLPIRIDPSNPTQLPAPNGLIGTFGDGEVMLQWDKDTLEQYYSYYIIEYSVDGGQTFLRVNEKPYVNLEMDLEEVQEKDFIFFHGEIDNALPEYKFRVKGVSPFGLTGPSSEVITGSGQPAPLPILPLISEVTEMQDGSFLLKWKINEALADSVSHFNVLHRATTEDLPSTINAVPVAAEDRLFQDNSPLDINYYQIEAIDIFGNSIHSTTVLAERIDSIPPAPPQGLVASVDSIADSVSIILLSWDPNTEPDLAGYHVYTSNSPIGEFTILTSSRMVTDSIFYDTIINHTLSETIWYKLRAVDFRGNLSALSETMALERPDITPPAPPSFSPSSAKSLQGISLEWANSPSSDVVSYQLQRKVAFIGEPWDVVFQTNKVKREMESYRDEVPIDQSYWYRIVTTDDVGLQTISDTLELRPTILDKSATIDGQHSFDLALINLPEGIQLSWNNDYPYPVNEVLIFRADNGARLHTQARLGETEITELVEAIEGRAAYLDVWCKEGHTYSYQVQVIYKNGARSSVSVNQEINR